MKGRRITGITNAEEKGFGKRWTSTYPIFLENALRKSGATFEQAEVTLPRARAERTLTRWPDNEPARKLLAAMKE